MRRHGITEFNRNPFFPVNTLRIMRGAVAADMDGGLAAYVEAVFHHMWEQPKKMDEPDVIRAALDESGLDGAAMLARDRGCRCQAAADRKHRASVARGTFGSPTFYIGNEIWFGKERLRDVEDAIIAA
jgi:2-hydroxychromene-2-carboxylate isomerase